MNFEYPSKCHLGRLSTPFTLLDRLSKKIGGPRIWIKRDDMTGFASGGNKIRKLEYLLADAKVKGCDTLVTQGAFQSNHCRATALLGNKMGFQTCLLLLGDLKTVSGDEIPDSNLFISRMAGVEVAYYEMETYYARMDEILDEKIAALEKSGRKPYKIPAGATSSLGLWGYIECAQELKMDFEREQITPDYIFHATGSAGTQAGLTLGKQLYNLKAEIFGVAVLENSAHFEEVVRKNMREWKSEFGIDVDVEALSINTLDQYIGNAYSEPDPGAYEAVTLLAELEGILLDPVYTGRGFQGLLKAIGNRTFSHARDIVFVHTGGAIGLFAKRKKISLDDSLTSVYRG